MLSTVSVSVVGTTKRSFFAKYSDYNWFF